MRPAATIESERAEAERHRANCAEQRNVELYEKLHAAEQRIAEQSRIIESRLLKLLFSKDTENTVARLRRLIGLEKWWLEVPSKEQPCRDHQAVQAELRALQLPVVFSREQAEQALDEIIAEHKP